MRGINFIAIDFETATGKRASVCEAGICVVRLQRLVRGLSVRKEIGTVIGICKFMEFVQATPWTHRSFPQYGLKSADTSKTFLYLWPTMRLLTSVASVIHWSCTVWKSPTSPIIVPSVQPAGSIISVATVWTTFVTSL